MIHNPHLQDGIFLPTLKSLQRNCNPENAIKMWADIAKTLFKVKTLYTVHIRYLDLKMG